MSNRAAKADVIVIGGGLHGSSAALALSERGRSVIVLEKDYPGRHASGVNAGGVRRLGRALEEVELSQAASQIWTHIEQRVGDSCGFTPAGQVKVAETVDELELLASRESTLLGLGYSHEQLISRETLLRDVPEISPHCTGALTCVNDGYANPYRTLMAFRMRATNQGAQYLCGRYATGITKTNGFWTIECSTGETFLGEQLINCAGAWAFDVCRLIGEAVGLRMDALMLAVTEPCARFVTPVIGATGRPLSFKQASNGTVIIGGGHKGVINTDHTTDINVREMKRNLQTAISLFPITSTLRIIRCWAGIEGCTDDGLPILGYSDIDSDIIHSFGYSGHGFQLSPITGMVVADLASGKRPDFDLRPFKIQRFQSEKESPHN